MIIEKVNSRNYNGKQYYKYRINIPEDKINEAGLKEGDDMEVSARKGELVFKRK